MTEIIGKLIAVAVIGYLIGSIPFGVLISKRRAKVDIRQYGSGKIGAANVLRTAGSKVAAVVLALDVSKGVLAVLFAGLIIGKDYLVVGNVGLGLIVAQGIAALTAVIGHIWSVFLGFKGGRGVATFFGGLAAMCPIAAAFGGEVLIISAGLSKYISLGSIAGAVGTYAILAPLTILHGFPIEYLAYTLVGAVLIIVMHRDNISRLVAGTERKIGEKVERKEIEPT